MFHRLSVKSSIAIRKEHRNSRIDQLRASIVEVAKKSSIITEDDMRWINFRPPPPYRILPKILYAQPIMHKKEFSVFAFGEDGKRILDKIGKALLKQGSLKVGDDQIGIEDFILIEDLPFLPTNGDGVKHYYTATPMILFDKKRDHMEYFAISKKFRDSDPAEYDRQMKKAIGNLIRANILYQLKQRVGERAYDFVKEINIEIKEFRFFAGEYHKDQPKTPMLFMSFSSDWTLPMFLGHHTGKGYGAISIDKRAGAAA